MADACLGIKGASVRARARDAAGEMEVGGLCARHRAVL